MINKGKAYHSPSPLLFLRRHPRVAQLLLITVLGYTLLVYLPIFVTRVLTTMGNSSTTTNSRNPTAAPTFSATTQSKQSYPLRCSEQVMAPKAHGTCTQAVMKNLRWGCDWDTADRICCFNRHYAEHSGYWQGVSLFISDMQKNAEITYYDSVTGKPLFVAPRGRTMEEFKKESLSHGWPSFRDEEVVWENVRCLPNGESVSVDGTHLGHNLPDRKGNRYCINLVSVAGMPPPVST